MYLHFVEVPNLDHVLSLSVTDNHYFYISLSRIQSNSKAEADSVVDYGVLGNDRLKTIQTWVASEPTTQKAATNHRYIVLGWGL